MHRFEKHQTGSQPQSGTEKNSHTSADCDNPPTADSEAGEHPEVIKVQ